MDVFLSIVSFPLLSLLVIVLWFYFVPSFQSFKLDECNQRTMTSNQGAPNMGHRHSLTIETNPLHLLPSNMRRFSQADSLRHPAAPLLAKLQAKAQPEIPETDSTEKKEDSKDEAATK
ncbi:hypothetical protein Y032_0017g3179 [Ancylostoma ceylanicum]|nr:hypothetical protein Y032_0017g3179 [Ancylostoma ceylanicum]